MRTTALTDPSAAAAAKVRALGATPRLVACGEAQLGGGTMYYQPVNEILQAYGPTLITGDGNPTPTPTSTGTGTPPPGGTWAPNTGYAAGAAVTYGGLSYRCPQGHTSQVGWEPPDVPALWAVA